MLILVTVVCGGLWLAPTIGNWVELRRTRTKLERAFAELGPLRSEDICQTEIRLIAYRGAGFILSTTYFGHNNGIWRGRGYAPPLETSGTLFLAPPNIWVNSVDEALEAIQDCYLKHVEK